MASFKAENPELFDAIHMPASYWKCIRKSLESACLHSTPLS